MAPSKVVQQVPVHQQDGVTWAGLDWIEDWHPATQITILDRMLFVVYLLAAVDLKEHPEVVIHVIPVVYTLVEDNLEISFSALDLVLEYRGKIPLFLGCLVVRLPSSLGLGVVFFHLLPSEELLTTNSV
jgi:hypothetical protein